MVSRTFAKNLYAKGRETTFDVVRLREDISLGQRVDAFELDCRKDGGWVTFAKGTSIGACRLIHLPERIRTSEVRLRVTQSAADPVVSELGLYLES